jgi:ribosome-binding protein aMBF1 (putative translation factor)
VRKIRKNVASLGERMKKAREKKGWSIDDLAREAGNPANILKSVETDKTMPPVALILQLSRTLKLNMEAEEPADGKKASNNRVKSHKTRQGWLLMLIRP